MTSRRHIGGVALAVAALGGFGDGWAQGSSDGQGAARRSDAATALQMQLQLFEATKRSNELAAEQNKQTKLILEQANALAEASARQSAEAEQTRQIAEASMKQNLQALAEMKTLVSRTLETAQSRKTFTEKILTFWSAVLALCILAAGYFNWREHKNMREKVARAVDEIRSSGLAELQKVLADLKAQKQVLLEDDVRRDRALAKKTVDS